jgi:hypothetical protein
MLRFGCRSGAVGLDGMEIIEHMYFLPATGGGIVDNIPYIYYVDIIERLFSEFTQMRSQVRALFRPPQSASLVILTDI